MSSPLQNKILKALFVALKPLAKSMLRAGIGYREFSDIAKAAFVLEASEGYGLRGRATNISRVAIMTGIARKEVKKVRDNCKQFHIKQKRNHPTHHSVSHYHI